MYLLKPLMLTSDSKRTKILVAAMVNNFCVKNAECTKVPVIDLIISILENDIGRGCVVTDKNEEDVCQCNTTHINCDVYSNTVNAFGYTVD